jgi:hypothetical protein
MIKCVDRTGYRVIRCNDTEWFKRYLPVLPLDLDVISGTVIGNVIGSLGGLMLLYEKARCAFGCKFGHATYCTTFTVQYYRELESFFVLLLYVDGFARAFLPGGTAPRPPKTNGRSYSQIGRSPSVSALKYSNIKIYFKVSCTDPSLGTYS